MSDHLEDRFRDFATGTPAMNPVHPAEIRRRGDRMRHRRTALTAAGAALAVALVATPITVLATGGDADVQPAPPSPTITDTPAVEPTETAAPPVAGRIPEDFPLDAGYPAANEDGTPVEVTATPTVDTIAPCDRTAWSPPADPVDVAGTSYLGPEDGRTRTLVLYPDAVAASAALVSFRNVVFDCSEQGDDGSAWAEESSSRLTGDSSVVSRRFLTGGRPNTGLEVYQLVRVGNAVLVDVTSGEGGATDSSVASFVDAVGAELEDVVAAMDTFRGNGRGAEPETALPDYFLPGPGELPTRERLTPWEEVATTEERLLGCQPEAGLQADEVIRQSYAARIAAVDGAPAGTDVSAEVRVTILQFASVAEAEAAETVVTGWIRDCADPADPALDRATRQGDLVETPQGTGTYGTWVYAAPEVCTDCDAAWFERMSVLADLGRMVVVSFREVGGPLEPEGLDATMVDLMLEVAARSMPG